VDGTTTAVVDCVLGIIGPTGGSVHLGLSPHTVIIFLRVVLVLEPEAVFVPL